MASAWKWNESMKTEAKYGFTWKWNESMKTEAKYGFAWKWNENMKTVGKRAIMETICTRKLAKRSKFKQKTVNKIILYSFEKYANFC